MKKELNDQDSTIENPDVPSSRRLPARPGAYPAFHPDGIVGPGLVEALIRYPDGLSRARIDGPPASAGSIVDCHGLHRSDDIASGERFMNSGFRIVGDFDLRARALIEENDLDVLCLGAIEH